MNNRKKYKKGSDMRTKEGGRGTEAKEKKLIWKAIREV